MINDSNADITSRYGRRDAIKLGGLTVSAAAILAACGNDRSGDTAPGRVGYAPPIEELQDLPVDDAVFLRTASSLEYTAIAVYEAVLETGLLDDNLTTLVERLIENHQMVADEMGELTESVGGVAWECTNPWYMARTVEPLLAAVLDSDDPLRDIINSAVTLENIAAATHQTLAIELTDADAAAATLAAAKLESRHSAVIVATARGADGYVSPTIDGDGDNPVDADGVPYKFAITSRFGSTGQVELVAGKPNENGVRQTFIVQTPSLNSWIYNELEPTC
jgi:rubrerythrin